MTQAPAGRIAANLVQFARALRAAGLPVGSGRVLDACRAVECVGLARRDDLYWTLHGVFVSRRDQRLVFDQCFHVFWRDPQLLERMRHLMLPPLAVEQPELGQPVSRRVGEAFAAEREPGQGEAPDEGPPEIDLDAVLTWSDRELLAGKDFEQMSVAELEAARRAIAGMRLPLAEVTTRRWRPAATAPRIDLRRTLRRSLREGSDVITLVRKAPVTRPPPLVILCDVSGSMVRYARMLLLFMHTLASDRDRVASFVFGTRLTNVTRALRARDVDQALAKVGSEVLDWSGGTRIGHCVERFNRDWSRRVLGQGAMVLLITDGLDRDAGEGLAPQMERLHKSCRRLVWLNPLLRWDGYTPIASGARAMLPHVDEVRAVHNLSSLADLANVLAAPAAPPRRPPGPAQMAA